MIDNASEYLSHIGTDGSWTREDRTRSADHGTVELWQINLFCDASLTSSANLFDCLDQGERARWARFKSDRNRNSFAAAHVALRHILGARLCVAPDAVALAADMNGKPGLSARTPGVGPRPAFSLTHSADRALVAVGTGSALGVDIECLRPLPELDALIAFACTPVEQAELQRACDLEARAWLFFSYWTRKEAALKAVGHGLRLPLKVIETARGPWVVPDPAGAPDTRVHVTPLTLDGAVGALAQVGDAPLIVWRDFTWANNAADLPRHHGAPRLAAA